MSGNEIEYSDTESPSKKPYQYDDFTIRNCLMKEIPGEMLASSSSGITKQENKGISFRRSLTENRPQMDTGHRTPDGWYICRVCGRKFANRFSLTGHYKSHYGYHEKPYACLDCGLRYTSPSNLHHHRAKKCAILRLKSQLSGRDPTLQKTDSTETQVLVQKALKVIERRNWLSSKRNMGQQSKSAAATSLKCSKATRQDAMKELIEIMSNFKNANPSITNVNECEESSCKVEYGAAMTSSELQQSTQPGIVPMIDLMSSYSHGDLNLVHQLQKSALLEIPHPQASPEKLDSEENSEVAIDLSMKRQIAIID